MPGKSAGMPLRFYYSTPHAQIWKSDIMCRLLTLSTGGTQGVPRFVGSSMIGENSHWLNDIHHDDTA